MIMQLDCFLEFKHHPNYQDSVIPIHKHRWQIRVAIASSKGDKVSYSALFTVVNSVLKRYDRVVINDVHPFDSIRPTHENIAKYLFNTIDDGVRNLGGQLSNINIWEDLELINQIERRCPEFDSLDQLADQDKPSKAVLSAGSSARGKLASLMLNITPPL
jgi:6-pyruvoyltetrahydropterin/6-carboxytetrahydropterin synthase